MKKLTEFKISFIEKIINIPFGEIFWQGKSSLEQLKKSMMNMTLSYIQNI